MSIINDTFRVDGKSVGSLVISDPCYERELWCNNNDVGPALAGIWNVTVEKSDEGAWGERNSVLMAIHEGFNEYNVTWIKRLTVGVDSGQAGIFCTSVYPQGDTGTFGWDPDTRSYAAPEGEQFYHECCMTTNADDGPGWGIVYGRGVVATSGYGDGSYPCYLAFDGGHIVGVKIQFLPYEFEDEEDEE